MIMSDPTPIAITLHRESRVLEISFDDGSRFELPCEYLRVYSPSAEVRGHGPGQETLPLNKEDVTITAVDPVGHYGIKPTFSDGHDTGIYTWKLLYDLGRHYNTLWQEYLGKVAAADRSRKA
ncbi:gamma-butyrobetaine hydroxylase-like domain-containing protein [Methylococcus capsulatus]|uniref:Gamma-butyrobetaine hydroxylase-like N-terminal domain-containing protein n=1 Tax=Methylococcus capsulatus (strain ATCC 33009 / NCIMB 11132 / Bath) TaxID=243233 RepID=Q606K0_METCA|nr:conserved hypothetical protein [Methylococcus capsulatus str. Bath]QXP87361.1 DUF971 domain-containing protein [Methylococcus capsulatus]QXP92898.1 DUF971 domain-containing protein [Methylococcus capsulatus]